MAGQWLLSRASTASVALVTTALLADALLPHGWGDAGWWVLGAGVLAGLPHGAVDHLLPSVRFAGRENRLARPELVGPAYLVVAVATFLAFRAAPAVGLVVFVAASVLHFGTGETAYAALRRGSAPARDLPQALAHGSVVVLLPLLGDPVRVHAVVAAILGRASVTMPSEVRRVGVALVLAGAALAVAREVRRGRLLESTELAVLTVGMVALPPLVAFGTYFGGWHALRHTARLLVEDPANARAFAAHRLADPLRRLLRYAALPSVVAVGGVLVLWSSASKWAGAAGDAVVMLAALSAPHFLIVALLDRADRRELPLALVAPEVGAAPPPAVTVRAG